MSGFTPGAGMGTQYGGGVPINPTTQNPWGDIFARAPGYNRYGEAMNRDPGLSILDSQVAAGLREDPVSWLREGIGHSGMRMNERLGRHVREYNQYLAPGLSMLYSQMTRHLGNDVDASNAGMDRWAANLISGSRGSGANEWLGTQGGRQIMGDLLSGNIAEDVRTAFQDPADPRSVVTLLQSIAFQSMTRPRFEAFMTEMNDKIADWQSFAVSTGEEIPFWDYLTRSGFLEYWGMAGR